MIFGIQLEWINLVYGGMVVMVLLIFQMLVGLRIIKFKGRTHMKVHRYIAWAMVAVATGHGFLALVVYNRWSVLS